MLSRRFLALLIFLLPIAASAQTSTTLYAQNFSGADFSVQINACITAVVTAGGGTCDATALGGATNQTASQQINVGDPAHQVAVTLILPNLANWYWGLTGGTNCAIYQYSGSTIEGSGVGGGGNQMRIYASSSANMKALYCTDTTNGNTVYLKAGNFSLNNFSGATLPYLADVENVVDETYIHDIIAVNDSGNSWLIQSLCCGTNFDRIQGYSSNGSYGHNDYAGGGVPLTLGTNNAITAVLIENSTFNAPGTGHPNISIGASSYGVTFLNDYMEGNCAADTTTAMVYIASGASGINFVGGSAWPYCTSATASSKYTFENHGVGFSVHDMVQGTFGGTNSYGGSWINDVSNSATVSGLGIMLPQSNPPYSSASGTHYSAGVSASSIFTLASAATIAPISSLIQMSGTATISTITPPTSFSSTVGGCLSIIATGAWKTSTSGNISTAITATAGTLYQACYIGSKWYLR